MGQVGFISRLRRLCFSGRKLRNEFLLACVVLNFCLRGALSSPQNEDSIQEKMRKFLSLHCNKQNQTLEQEEYETFIRCNPTQAAMIIRNIDSHKELDPEAKHSAIQNEVANQCSDWPTKRTCQKKNFRLIEKCFDGQQKFVFYFLLALTDTICQDGNLFIEFWEKGGDKCLNQHLSNLTKEINSCLTFTATMTKEELDRNLEKITGCIGNKLADCGTPESNNIIQNLLQDIESFYNEIRTSAFTSLSPSLFQATQIGIVITLSIFLALLGPGTMFR